MTDAAPPRTSERRLFPLNLLVTVGLADVTLALLGASGASAQALDRPIVSVPANSAAMRRMSRSGGYWPGAQQK